MPHWQCGSTPAKSDAPQSVPAAIAKLEAALDAIAQGLLKADELNAETAKVAAASGATPRMVIRFSEPPEHMKGWPSGPVGPAKFWWEGKTLHSEGLGRCEPQTLFVQLNGGAWEPSFPMQVQSPTG